MGSSPNVLHCVFEWVVLWVVLWLGAWVVGAWIALVLGSLTQWLTQLWDSVVWAGRGGAVRCVHNFVLWFFSYETETETELHM